MSVASQVVNRLRRFYSPRISQGHEKHSSGERGRLRNNHKHTLRMEPLEDRRMLSVGGYPELPGLDLVDPRPDQFEGQVIYLNFDGAEDVTYNGPVVVEDIDVPAFEAPGNLAGQEQEIVGQILLQLADAFDGSGLVFTTEHPADGAEYSTIYIGGGNQAFSEYGSFQGLAETIDIGNQIKDDNAFVFSDCVPLDELADTTTHEIGHLLGYAHTDDDTPGDNISDYAQDYKQSLMSNEDNPTYGSYSSSITVEKGSSHRFIVDGVWGTSESCHYKWYSTNSGTSGLLDSGTSYTGNSWCDPTISRTFNSTGSYVVRAEIWDRTWTGGTGEWWEAHRWYVTVVYDNLGPYGVGSLDLESYDDTGSSSSDNITKNDDLDFDWTAPSDRGVSGVVSGVKGYYYSLSDSTPDSGDSYTTSTSCTINNISAGNHTLYVRAIDNNDNYGDVRSLSFTVDKTAPGRPTLYSPPHNSETGDQTPTFDWSTVSSTHHYEIEVWDGDPFWGDISDTTTSSSYTPGSNIPYDTVYWKTRAVDTAGNFGSWSDTWTLDIVAPAVTRAYWLDPHVVLEGTQVTMRAQVKGFDEGDQFTFEIWEDDTFPAPDQRPPNVTTRYGNVYKSGSDYYVSATWTAEWMADIYDDPEYFFVVSRGSVSLTSSSSKPEQMTVLPVNVEITDAWVHSSSDPDGDTYVSSLDVRYTAKTDVGSKQVYAKLLRDNATLGETTLVVSSPFSIGTSLATKTLSFTNIDTLSKGSHDLRVRLYDANSHDEVAAITEGDPNGSDLANILIEKTSDEILPPPKPTGVKVSSSSDEDTGKSQSDGITKNDKPLFVWSAPSVPTGIARYEYQIDGESTVHSTGSSSSQWRPGLLDSAFSDSEHTIRFRAVESQENRPGGWSDTYYFTIDTTDPGVPGELSNPQNLTTDVTPNVTWSEATETGSGIWKYEIVFDDGDWDFGLIRDRTFWSANGDTDLDDSEVTTALTVGSWQWWVQAYDVAGNQGGWAPGYFDGKAIEIVEPTLTSVQWKTTSGGTVTDGQQFKVGDDVHIYVEADYAQIGDSFTVYVYEDDGVDFDDLIDTVQVPILTSDGTQGTGYAIWEVPWHPDNNFASDIGIGDIYPEYRLWDTTSGWTWWPASTHKSDALIEAHGGTLEEGNWTVVIHGLVPTEGDIESYSDLTTSDGDNSTSEGWMWEIGARLKNESGKVAIHTIDVNAYDRLTDIIQPGEPLDGSGSIEVTSGEYHHVLLFDWAEVSNYIDDFAKVETIAEAITDGLLSLFPPGEQLNLLLNAFGVTDIPSLTASIVTGFVDNLVQISPPGASGEDGYAESSADFLYGLLEGVGIADKVDKIIGHSRGAIVATETAQRLLQAPNGTTLDQVIFLDAEGGSFWDILYSDYNYHAWNGLRTDHYWQSYDVGNDTFNLLGPDVLHTNLDTSTLTDRLAGAKSAMPDYDFFDTTPIPLPDLYGEVYTHSQFPTYLSGVNRDPGSGLFIVDGFVETTGSLQSVVAGSTRAVGYDAPVPLEIFNGNFGYDSTAGWWYHGGGNDLSSAGGGTVENGQLVLEQGESRTHNWAYVPATAKSVEFDFDVTDTSSISELVVSWGDENNSWTEIGWLPLTWSGLTTNQLVDLPTGEAGEVGRLKFAVVGSDSANVRLDNISWSEQFAPAPEIDVERGGTNDVHSHNFGNVPIGQSANVTLTVRNEGDATLTVEQASGLGTPFTINPVNGSGSGDDWTIAPSGTRTFNVTFSPTSVTSYSDTLTLVNNDKDEGSYQISFSGSGIAPDIDVELPGQPDNVHSYSFGKVRMGQSASQTFTVHNEGNATLTVTQASGLETPFTVTPINDNGSGDDWTIGPGGTTTFTVTFAPTAVKGYSDTLTLASNDADEGSYQISLSGTGIDDTIPPTVVSVTVNDALVSDADAGLGKFTVTVLFDESMDTGVAPVLGYDPDHQRTLTSPSGIWSQTTLANDTYTVTYDVTDQEVEIANIEIDITNARDVAGNLQKDYAPEAEFSIDTTAPEAVGWGIGNGTAQRSMIRAVRIEFSENVSSSLTVDSLTLTNLTTGEVIDSSNLALAYDSVTDAATWSVVDLPGLRLPDGQYRATLHATRVSDPAGNLLAEDYTFEFFTFFGDSDGDRDVDIADLFTFRKTYQKDSTDPAFNPAFDSDADGDVDSADLSRFRENYQKTLEMPFDIVLSGDSLLVSEGETAEFTVVLSAAPVYPVTVTIAKNDGDEDLSVFSGNTLTFDSTNWNTPQTVTLFAEEDTDSLAGIATFIVTCDNALNSPVLTATEKENDNPLSDEGWSSWLADSAGTNYYPYGSTVRTSTSLELETTLGTADGFSMTADVDGDGKLELICVQGTELTVYDELNQIQTQVTLPANGTLSVVDDFDGDGSLEIGISAKQDNATTAYCYFYAGDGTLLQTFERSVGYDGAIFPLAVVEPGTVLVAGAAGYSKDPRGLFAYDYATGTEVWGYDIGCPYSRGTTSVADIDGDGKQEFTVSWATPHNGNSANGTTDGELYLTVTDDDGTNLLTQKYPSPDEGSAYHIFTDFEEDGTYEILAIERHDPRYYQGVNEVHLYDLAGNTLYSYSGPTDEDWLWAVGDVDTDGRQNVVVGGYSVLTILDDQLQEVRSINEDGFVQLVADLTGDGYCEIVTINVDNLLRVYDYELNLLDSIQLTGDVAITQGVIASDIDADGIVELIVRSSVGSHIVSFAAEEPVEYVAFTESPVVSEGETAKVNVPVPEDLSTVIAVAVEQTEDDKDVNVETDETPIHDNAEWDVSQKITVVATQDELASDMGDSDNDAVDSATNTLQSVEEAGFDSSRDNWDSDEDSTDVIEPNKEVDGTATDFTFHVGDKDDMTNSDIEFASPSAMVVEDNEANGSDQAIQAQPGNTIQGVRLETTKPAFDNTHLDEPEIFRLENAGGEITVSMVNVINTSEQATAPNDTEKNDAAIEVLVVDSAGTQTLDRQMKPFIEPLAIELAWLRQMEESSQVKPAIRSQKTVEDAVDLLMATL